MRLPPTPARVGPSSEIEGAGDSVSALHLCVPLAGSSGRGCCKQGLVGPLPQLEGTGRQCQEEAERQQGHMSRLGAARRVGEAAGRCDEDTGHGLTPVGQGLDAHVHPPG